jgi:hypothetical protein
MSQELQSDMYVPTNKHLKIQVSFHLSVSLPQCCTLIFTLPQEKRVKPENPQTKQWSFSIQKSVERKVFSDCFPSVLKVL